MITYGVISGVSIGGMFMAGLLPAGVIIVSLTIMLVIMGVRMNLPRVPFSASALLHAFIQAFWALMVPVIIMGGIYGGVFTPTEAAAIAVLYGLIVSMVFYRELRFAQLPRILVNAGLSTAIVMFIIATSSAFAWLLTSAQVPTAIAQVVLGVSQNKMLIMLLINAILLLFGVFLETNAIILLLTPMLLPLADRIGLDLMLLGVIIVVNTSVGMVTPPMALNIFIASSVGGESIERISKKIIPFLVMLIIDTLIITYFPSVALSIPDLLGQR